MVSKEEVRLSFIRCAVLATVVQCSNAAMLSILSRFEMSDGIPFRTIAESLMVDSDLQPNVCICIGMLSSIA